jgi:hypothetical protein
MSKSTAIFSFTIGYLIYIGYVATQVSEKINNIKTITITNKQ